MLTKKESAVARREPARDPFSMLRRMTSDLDRMFEPFDWPAVRWPALRARPLPEEARWFPQVDVFEENQQLVTRVDLPGMKKEDVTVEVADDQLTISGERRSEAEEKRENFYRCERGYGSFFRSVPLPEGVKPDDVKATFTDGVLEVRMPLSAKPESRTRQVEIQDARSGSKPAA